MPELIAEAFAAVDEDMSDWLTLTRLDPAYRAHFPDGSTLDVIADSVRMAAEIVPRLRAPGGRRLPALRRRTPAGLWQLQRDDFIDRNLDGPRRSGHAELAAAAVGRRVPPPGHQGRAVLPGPAHPAGLLVPVDVRRARAAPGARALRGDRLPGHGRRGLLPARRHPRRPDRAGRGGRQARRHVPLRHHGHPGRGGRRPGPGRAHRRRRADPGRRGGAQPGPAGRLPDLLPADRGTGAATPRPAALLAVRRGAARRLDPALLEDRPPQHPLRPGLARHVRRRDPSRSPDARSRRCW